MPSFADSIFLFILALLLFGPKKLPVLARELGKWMGEFRRASNEFKMQMEDELRASEQADRQKQIAAMEAAAPIPPPLGDPAEPEHPHMRGGAPALAPGPSLLAPEPSLLAPEPSLLAPEPSMLPPEPSMLAPQPNPTTSTADATTDRHPERSAAESKDLSISPREGQRHEPAHNAAAPPASSVTADGVRPVPIATSGSLHMMPPATGLPIARSGRPNNALSGLVDAIPEAPAADTRTVTEAESLAHGD